MLALGLAACGGDDGGGGGEGGEQVTLTWLVANAPDAVTPAEALSSAFQKQNPNVKIEIETRPQGGEGDNLVKTRLATQEMADLFSYNSGSLFQALRPQNVLTPLTDEPWVGKLDDAFKPSVTAGGDVYGVPFGSSLGGGVLYNKKVYDRLGLEIPKTWDEFMANNEKIKAEGIDPVIQSYQDTWTSQLFVLADFHNVAAEDPDWADKYTKNQVKYAQEPAVEGFKHLEEVNKAGYMNENFGSIKFERALSMLAKGQGAHYPILTSTLPNVETSDPGRVKDIGFFGIPGNDADSAGATLWLPGATYIPRTTEGEKLDAAKRFLAFMASPEGCDIYAKAWAPTGPFMVDGCELPKSVPPAVQDVQRYVDEQKVTPALEFSSPVKGPALEQITVEVGSGIRGAEDGAALYDQDVEKQAQQLGLEGW
ncbi:MAG TPA: extracellular solute-binding protein [Solirubrobacteraceae bacterium]|nr:extracellular solute-binding protein [Solirubrobacteraceae bacterium]